MKLIRLTNGADALVDDEDYDYLMQWSWSQHKEGYVVSGSARYRRYMHREVAKRAGFDVSRTIDHRFGNKLDNRRSELRPASYSNNCANRPKNKNNKSGFKGVSWDTRRNRWRVVITKSRRQIHVGYSDDKIEAARKYNEAATKHFGEFAYLNSV